MADIFEKASRMQIRFQTRKGELNCEDLWELSLESLDELAKGVNKQLKESEEESFIGKSRNNSKYALLSLKLDILKRIIEVRLKERELATSRSENAAKLARLKEIALIKDAEELTSKSREEINAMIKELEGK